ncbi:MAG: hypothetical protein ACYTG0_17455 [Planctomycetota bacterium]|jgi:hypothetical protein
MRRNPLRQLVLPLLIAAAVFLLISVAVLVALAELLATMGDAGGVPKVLKYIALGIGTLLVVDLVCLILVQGISLVGGDRDSPDEN